MAATIGNTAVYAAPASGGSTTTRTLTCPTVTDGQILILALSKNGSANGFTIGGLGFTLLDTSTSSGHWSAIYYRIATAADSGSPITITTAAAYRASATLIAVNGVTGINAYGKALTASGTSVACPAVTPSADSIRLDFVTTSGGDPGISINTPAGMTETTHAYDAAASGSGYANVKAAHKLTATASAVAAQTYTSTTGTSAVLTGWTILLSVAVASTTAVPIELTANTGGWTNQGTAGSIPAALADSTDTTYAQSPVAPASASMQVKFGELAGGLVTVSYDADTDGGTCSCVVTLYQGVTSIASWTDTWTPTQATFTHTTTSGQAAAITDRTNLRVTFSLTAS